MSDHQQFALDVAAFSKKAGLNVHAVVRKVVLDLGTRIVMRSPVGNPRKWKGDAPKGYVGGRFRANWQYSVGEPRSGALNVVDRTGRASIARIQAGMPPDAGGRVHFITNNLPYAQKLETGWSKQAPGGMVGLAIAEYQAIVNKAAREVHG